MQQIDREICDLAIIGCLSDQQAKNLIDISLARLGVSPPGPPEKGPSSDIWVEHVLLSLWGYLTKKAS